MALTDAGVATLVQEALAEVFAAGLRDPRVGFNSNQFIDYGRPEHRAETRRIIRRFRLEKQNPEAEISDPVEPIVYWIDPATPEWPG